jgi:isoleucyl-tRNA synthetase
MGPDLKDTLQLPKTDFPMRAGLAQREPGRVEHWARIGLYGRIQDLRRAGDRVFVLHDGPPFTNGDVHIGTALNKVLKDVINRYKSMRGFRTPYVPGWDCHGLPIEQKVAREIQEQKLQVTTAELRARCDAFSEQWIGRQTGQFQRLGILADWASGYRTKAPGYEADILRTFAAFLDKDLVYRSKKPVYWSIPFETALAEAEIEYKEHVSPSIWVAFPVRAADAEAFGLPADKPLAVVIWTTTPWTLPANLAIAVNPKTVYAVVEAVSGRFAGQRFVVAEACAGAFIPRLDPAAAAGGASPGRIVATKTGSELERLQARHPFIDRASPVLLADYVTTDSGTGCVHTAPGHGAEDYATGLRYGLEIYCPVGADGRYLDDGRVPADLVGLSALESVEDLEKKRTSAANVGVLKKLDAAGALVSKERHSHSYPHCWRSKTPIIFRAVDQWFVGLDRDGTREKALESIRRIGEAKGWIPAWGEARIRGAVESRPDWCVSRQRSWGVPIPAFYDAEKRAYLDAGVVRAIADRIGRSGSNLWYDSTPEELLAGVALPAGWPAPSALSCGRDTLDVWIDSGSSHEAVLRRGLGGTRWPADLYLEGSDQHRGWFQSSLWTSIIARGEPPYRSVLTHGFIVDEDRKKISKSSTYEKPQTSDAYVADYGADVIRLWIASQDFRDDIPISKEILSHVGETYRQIRNTFRYQLANLFDFDPARDAVPVAGLDPIDRWALGQAAELVRSCTEAYETYQFHRVYQLCNQFCSVTLSATYHDILKDRLYTLGAKDPLRRSSQTAIHHIFGVLSRVLAPILVFTADEAWSFATARAEYAADSIHLRDWPEAPADWTDESLQRDMAALLALRGRVNEEIERHRAAGAIGKSLDAAVAISVAPGPLEAVLRARERMLPEWFIVSRVEVRAAAGGPETIEVKPAKDLGFHRCPRCWRSVPALVPRPGSEPVCSRCFGALNP